MRNSCLSYWFPKLLAASLPCPRTEIVRASPEVIDNLLRMVSGEDVAHDFCWRFMADLEAAIRHIGLPAFLRTGQGSGKHQWDECCNLRNQNLLMAHVFNLVEWSECVDMIGLPVDVWCVREFLPTIPQMVADRYGNMPVCREFRCFVNGPEVLCRHPYWPKDSLVQGMSVLPDDFDARYERLCNLPPIEAGEVESLASRAGAALGGAWSVDILDTKIGWHVTDCAIAERSYHWPDCPKNT